MFISNDPEFNTFYIKNVDSGNIFFKNYVNCKASYECILWPIKPQNSCMQTYFNHNYWHGMQFVLNKNDAFVEVAGFATKQDNSEIIDFYYKNTLALEKFVNRFKQNFREQIVVPDFDKRLATFAGKFDMYIPDNQILKEQKIIQSFYEALGIEGKNLEPIKITPCELKILKFTCQGYNAKHIANELQISHRTVENHLYQIKQKTGYNYKNDLVKIFHDLF